MTAHRFLFQTVLVLAAALAFATPVQAVSTAKIIGETVEDLRGLPVGHVDEFIVDVERGRVLYVVIDSGEHFHTLPVRAIHTVTGRRALQVDMDLVDSVAGIGRHAEPRFRRATRLIGGSIGLPDGDRQGTIHDLHFELETGAITRVLIATAEGERSFPAQTLLDARIEPATQPQLK